MARAVAALSVSTTVRTPPPAVAVGFDTGPAGLAAGPGFGPIPTAGPAGAAGFAPGTAGAGFAPPPTPGLGGSEILMVSLRRSPPTFAAPGTEGIGGLAPPGIGGGLPAGTGGLGRTGAGGADGLGGGVNLMVSFFTPGTGGTGSPTLGAAGADAG